MTSRNSVNDSARKQASAVARITGEWFCQSGMHYTHAPEATYRQRRICQPCKERIQKLAGKRK